MGFLHEQLSLSQGSPFPTQSYTEVREFPAYGADRSPPEAGRCYDVLIRDTPQRTLITYSATHLLVRKVFLPERCPSKIFSHVSERELHSHPTQSDQVPQER